MDQVNQSPSSFPGINPQASSTDAITQALKIFGKTQKQHQQQQEQSQQDYAAYQQAVAQAQQNQQTQSQSAPQGAAQQGAVSQMGGQSSSTGHDWSGLCQAYAEQQTYGHTGIFPTASAAFDAYSKAGQTVSAKDAKPGDLVYFQSDASNDGAGHVGIYQGGGKFQSATYNGVETDNIQDWQKMTGQKIAGFVKPQQ